MSVAEDSRARTGASARAFAPGNISGVFKIVANPDPAKAHSLGWGFTVADGVDVTVTRADADAADPTQAAVDPGPRSPNADGAADESPTTVVFNGAPIDFPTVVSAVASVTPEPLAIDIRTPLPLSSGFGLSGASAYAACLAANALLDAGHSDRELAMMAHIAEVENLTGLGDVCAQRAGGCLVKVVPGDPLDAVPIAVEPRPVYWRYLSPISTREVLRDERRHQRINSAADAALETIAAMIGSGSERLFERLLDVALGFATSSGLLADNQVKAGIAQARAAGGAATMIMLGNAVVSTVPFDGCSQTELATAPGRLVG